MATHSFEFFFAPAVELLPIVWPNCHRFLRGFEAA
jgi:hypothetical protein